MKRASRSGHQSAFRAGGTWTIAGEKQSEVMTGVVFQRYQERLLLGQIEPDAAQGEAVVELDRLASALAGWRPAKPGLFSFLGREKGVRPRGLYLHGGVGRGKTMLMDLFFEAVDFKPKRRTHFHAFMAEAHERIAIARTKVDGDPIPLVALEMAGDPGLLCFDELHVTDIADAMILGRFFKVVFERGVVIVATSNAHPAELYRHGLNRQLFLPFIDLIEDNLDVREIKAQKDFRLDKLAGRPLYFSPADASATAELDRHWVRLAGSEAHGGSHIEIKGRRLVVPRAAPEMGVARFSFADLCEKPLSSVDYLGLTQVFHTILIDGIPRLDPARRDTARRFINLIDTLY
ncbi:MAG: cell division protein ZapE, partial [Hyphomicrobium sp.]